MSLTQLRIPFLEGGIRSTNFFNGRLLSGEDMTTEHAAMLERSGRLGEAVGSGVAYGLEVQLRAQGGSPPPEPASPVLTVSAGLAINRCGQPVKLLKSVDVALVRSINGVAKATNTQTFSCCEPPKAGGRLAGDGVYLLTIAPASGREGRATVNGISTDSVKCNSKYLVEGAQFNLVPIADPFLTADDFSAANLPFLRNRIAYKCFGVEEQAGLVLDPFGTPLEEYGVVDDLLRTGTLSKSEVPLAIAYWTSTNGIEFLDLWAVRRRIVKRSFGDSLFPFIADRRAGEAEARFLQFQEQLADMVANEHDLLTIKATERFDYLPAAGIMPLGGQKAAQGFNTSAFFDGLTHRAPVFIEGVKVCPLIHDSLTYPPIVLASKELIWLYLVRENIEGINTAMSAPPQPYLLLVNGQVSFRGEARYDLSRWSYSNYC